MCKRGRGCKCQSFTGYISDWLRDQNHLVVTINELMIRLHGTIRVPC